MEQPKYFDTIKELILDTSASYKDDVAFRVKTKAGKNPEYKDIHIPILSRISMPSEPRFTRAGLRAAGSL